MVKLFTREQAREWLRENNLKDGKRINNFAVLYRTVPNFLQYIQKRNFESIVEFQSLDMLIAPVHAVWKGMMLERTDLFKGTVAST